METRCESTLRAHNFRRHTVTDDKTYLKSYRLLKAVDVKLTKHEVDLLHVFHGSFSFFGQLVDDADFVRTSGVFETFADQNYQLQHGHRVFLGDCV